MSRGVDLQLRPNADRLSVHGMADMALCGLGWRLCGWAAFHNEGAVEHIHAAGKAELP